MSIQADTQGCEDIVFKHIHAASTLSARLLLLSHSEAI